MKRSDLIFDRPSELAATMPAEARGRKRDEGRLMVTTPDGQHQHARFFELANFLQAGDVVVVNNSATLPASLPAHGRLGDFIVNLSTDYGGGVWLAEPRWSSSQPGPMPLERGEVFQVAGLDVRLIAAYPGLPRLWFIRFDGDVWAAMERSGQPIRYGYVNEAFALEHYQTVFAQIPGSAEMPSAAYAFTPRVVDSLRAKGVQIVPITLHTGVSSLEVEAEDIEAHTLYPEPYHVPQATADVINRARQEGRRVIAIGTTVIRALESAWDGYQVQAKQGFTRIYVHPARGIHAVDGLLTGMHDPLTSHLAMLYAIASSEIIKSGYAEAVREGYLWHEFGDAHLILSKNPAYGVTLCAGRYEVVKRSLN
jgi:S-adenosylmethionine:tRNA ribosyltransferase-isomerase